MVQRDADYDEGHKKERLEHHFYELSIDVDRMDAAVKNRLIKVCLFSSLLTMASANSHAQEIERIETDRHEFTPSVLVVPEGMAQIESGYSFFKDGDETVHTGPELLLRYGLTENVELRLRYNEAWRFGEDHRSGSEDLRIGTKLRLNDQRGWIPEAVALLTLSVPTGSEDWTLDSTEFGISYVYGWDIAEGVEIYGSTGLATNGLGDFDFLPEAADDDFTVFSQSISVGAILTERVTCYAEFFGLFTNNFVDDEDNQVFYNMGADYYLTNDFLIDARAGVGLTSDSADFFCGLGGAFRF